jgi:hypothetical protein
MTRSLRDGSGVEWECTEIPGSHADTARSGPQDARAFIAYSCYRKGFPDGGGRQILVPRTWDLDDPHVQSIAMGDLLKTPEL